MLPAGTWRQKEGGRPKTQSPHPMSMIWSVCSAIVLSVALSACGAGHHTTVADSADVPKAEENLVSQDVAEVAQEEPNKVADVVPKRNPNDPIYVNLAVPVLDNRMRKAEKPKGAITQHLRNEFSSDPIIQLIPIPNAKSAKKRKASQVTPPTPDVEVASTVSVQEVLGVNAKTGKPKKILNIVYEATISSQSPPATYTVSESGHILKNMAVSKRFAKQIRDVIVEKIGPEIPAR